MISPKKEWIQFESLQEKINILKDFEALSPQATKLKDFYYKGHYTDYEAVKCDVVGYIDKFTLVINVDGNLHCILPECFVEMQKRERFIVLDIETPQSFSPSSGIREVAAIFVEDYRVTDSIHLAIINDKEKYTLGYGHGLEAIESNEELKEQFKAFIKKYRCPIIAHNASFDRSFLRHWGWVDDKQKFLCSMNNIKSRYNLPNYKMLTLLKHFNIKQDQSHSAMDDIMDLLEILKIVKVDKWSLLGQSSTPVKESQSSSDVAPQQKFKYLSKDEKANNKKKLELAKENIIKDIFSGKKMVFTGDMEKDRLDMMELAIKYGASPTTGVSKKTELLIIGDNPGKSKLEKAKELNIEIISEKTFLDIINEI